MAKSWRPVEPGPALVPVTRTRPPPGLTEMARAPMQPGEGAPPAWLVFEASVADALRDLRTGVVMIALQEVAKDLNKRARDAMTGVFDGIAAHFRASARGRRQLPAPALLGYLDRLIGDILATSSPSARHKGLAAAVGVRRNLYPDAPPFAGEPQPHGDAA